MDIDERVAIEVMGWESIDYPIRGWLTKKPCTLMDLMRVENWQPSKRIDQAWMIFEQLEEDWQLNAVGGKYMLWQEKTLGPWADTAPMAICLASLKAKEK